MTDFHEVILDKDVETLVEEMDGDIQSHFEDWDPAAGGLAPWIRETFARHLVTTREQFATSAREHFKRFGQTIVSVPPILAAPATVSSTWSVIDKAGYTIKPGDEVIVAAAGDESHAFEVVNEVTIPPGSTETKAGEVLLQAILPGEVANGLSGEARPSVLAFVDSISLVGESANGVDEEDEDAYLVRLVERMQLFSESLIVKRDFEIDARSVAGIARALCIPGYDAEAKTEDNPLTFTTFPVDADGAAMSSPIKEELKDRQIEKVPSGVEEGVFVADPTFTKVDVSLEITVLPGFDPEATKTAAAAAIFSYLSPANWGLPSTGDAGASTGWENATTVYHHELVVVGNLVAGVDRVVKLTLAEDGKELKAEDLALKGPAPLTKPADIVVTVV